MGSVTYTPAMRVVFVLFLLVSAAVASGPRFRGSSTASQQSSAAHNITGTNGAIELGNQSENETAIDEPETVAMTWTSTMTSTTATTTTSTETTTSTTPITTSTTPTTSLTTTSTTATSVTTTTTDPMAAVLSENWFSTLCATAQHVTCDDAICQKPDNGVAACNCRIEKTMDASILPSEVAGAPALTGSFNFGLFMCIQMNAGSLYSAFSPSALGYSLSSVRLANCPIRADFEMCWGAPCEANATHPERATCQCPVQTGNAMPVYMDRYFVVPSSDCVGKQDGRMCDRVAAAGRDWMATVVSAFAPEDYLDGMVCNPDP